MDFHDTLIYKVKALSRRLDNVLDEIVRQNGIINYAQYKVLVAIHEAGRSSISGVAAWLELSVPTASHLCHKLEMNGYISIGLDDLKTKNMTLTTKGVATLETLNPLLENALGERLDVLSSKEQHAFMASIDVLTKTIDAKEPSC